MWMISALLPVLLMVAAPAMTKAEGLAELLTEGDYDAAVEEVRGEQDRYLAELIERALRLRLDEDPRWHALLHYRKGWFGGYVSEVDGENFFTSRRGKTDPQQELLTTLASFFSTRPVPPSIHTPQCRFLARYTWLDRRLDFNPERLPEQSCDPYRVFYDATEPIGLTVVFPSTHPNSPSSMFGHTLVRVDSRGHSGASRMLDYTINYAAEADTHDGVAYAIKGLAGGFYGRFRIVPYHVKLREYAQMENRDIWEYRLKVSQETVDFVLMHAWELLGTQFDYYFFTENCSYHVLTLLEADLYEYDMVGEFHGWVLPTDTLRALARNGLVDHVDYYPSDYRAIVARRERLGEAERQLARAIYRDGPEVHAPRLAALPVDEGAATLDMAYDYVRYRRIEVSDVMSPELTKREKELLIARSRLRVASPPLEVPQPGVRPDQGHDTARFTVGLGGDRSGAFIKLGWRGVYHDWLDPADGYAGNFALEFGRLDLRYYPDGLAAKHLKLDRLHLINLDNFEPVDDFFHRISWHVTTGVESVYNSAEKGDLSFMVRGGPGLTYRLGHGPTLAYVGLDGEIAYGGAFRGDYYLGAGPALALKKNLGDAWRLEVSGRYLAGLARDPRDRAVLAAEQSLRLGTDVTLNVGLGRKRGLDGWTTEGSVWLNVYY